MILRGFPVQVSLFYRRRVSAHFYEGFEKTTEGQILDVPLQQSILGRSNVNPVTS
jgi:hypothetical protein